MTQRPKFFTLTIGMFSQYKYAWYEPYGKANYSRDGPRCPKCGRAVGGLYWEPPYNVILKQPRKIGDFIAGPGGCDFLVSPSFLNIYAQEKLSGIEKVLPIQVCRMGTSKKRKSQDPPEISGVYLRHSLTQVKHSEMGVAWMSSANPDYCRLCGPGGGGVGGVIKSWEKIVVDDQNWQGEDIFYAINFSGRILLSEKAAQVIVNHSLTNAAITPCEEAKFSYGLL